jgi:ankyrin repeat protein
MFVRKITRVVPFIVLAGFLLSLLAATGILGAHRALTRGATDLRALTRIANRGQAAFAGTALRIMPSRAITTLHNSTPRVANAQPITAPFQTSLSQKPSLNTLHERGLSTGVKAIDKNNEELLSIAIINGYNEMVLPLIKAGVDLNAKGLWNRTPLDLAISQNNLTIAALLIKNGAALEAKGGYFESTPLLQAISTGNHLGLDNKGNFLDNREMIALLIEHGADVNAKDKNGNTPLINTVRCYKDRHKIVDLLIKAGANVHLKNKAGTTPLFAALRNGCCKSATLLIQAGATINATDVNEIDGYNGRTLLHDVARAYWNHHEIADLIIKAGADVNAKDELGETALHSAIASYCPNCKIMALLIKHRVDVNAKNKRGQTALDLAMYRHDRKAVNLLKRAGAHVNKLALLKYYAPGALFLGGLGYAGLSAYNWWYK